MPDAPNLAPKDNALVKRQIQEIREALEAFKAAVESGEVNGFKATSIKGMTAKSRTPIEAVESTSESFQENYKRSIITFLCRRRTSAILGFLCIQLTCKSWQRGYGDTERELGE